jgi:hypothetical protein
MLVYTGQGGFTLGSSAEVVATYNFIVPFTWNIDSYININYAFNWAVGDQPLRWYSISSTPPPANSLTANKNSCNSNCSNNSGGSKNSPTCQLTVMAATSVANLCNQLAESGFTGKITSITVQTTPTVDDTALPYPPAQCQNAPFQNVLPCQQFGLQSDPLLPAVVTVTAGFAENLEYAGTGGMGLSGNAICTTTGSMVVSYTYYASGLSPTLSAIINLGGSATVVGLNYAYSYIGQGGLVLGGTAGGAISVFSYVGSGGLVLGGLAREVSPDWNYTGEGGLVLGGFNVPNQYGSGGMTLAGNALTLLSLSYVGQGGMVLGGSGSEISPSYSHIGQGGMVLGGSASARSNFYDLSDSWVSEASIPFIDAEFTVSQATNLVAPTETISTSCGCLSLPLTLEMQSNFGMTNQFAQFLSRNNLSFSTAQFLYYSRLSSAWQGNTHLRGLSEDGNSSEQWNVVFEWGCTSQYGGQDLGQSVWQFLAYFVRRNLTTGSQQASKLVVVLDSLNLCQDVNSFGVSFTLDTLTGSVTLPSIATLNLQVLSDGIGLFQGAWNDSPDLNVSIALVPPTLTSTLVDGTQLLLKTPSIFND